MRPLLPKLSRQVNERLQLQEARAAAQDGRLAREHQVGRVRFEERYQHLAAGYFRAQAAFYAAQGKCRRLQGVVRAKQLLVEELLPYYPHALTPAQ